MFDYNPSRCDAAGKHSYAASADPLLLVGMTFNMERRFFEDLISECSKSKF